MVTIKAGMMAVAYIQRQAPERVNDFETAGV
jgi:hypothetical protein